MDTDSIVLAVTLVAVGLIAWLATRVRWQTDSTRTAMAKAMAKAMASRGQLPPYVINNPAGAGVVNATLLPGTGRGYFVEVVGESHYQAALATCPVDAHGDSELSVILSPEPGAVVVKTLQNATIGYLGAENAMRYQPTLLELRRRGLVSLCAAKLFGGLGDRKTIGVWLDLEEPASVAKKLGVS